MTSIERQKAALFGLGATLELALFYANVLGLSAVIDTLLEAKKRALEAAIQ